MDERTGAENAPPMTRPPLSLPSKLAYAVGSVAFGLKSVAIGLVMLFYNQVMGLPAGWVSLGIGIALIVDAIASPIIGQVSDMWRSRLGRRHPFMYAAAAPAAVAVWALLNPPHDWPPHQLFGYMLVCILAARVAIAMFEIPNASLLPELVPDYDERTVVSGYRNLLLIVVPVIVVIIALVFVLRPFVNDAGQQMPGQLNPEGYSRYGLMLAAIIFIAIMLSALGTQREVKYLSAPVKHASLADLFGTIRGTLFNRNFLVLTLSGVVSGIGAGLIGGLTDYFNTFFWELSAAEISFITGAVGLAPFVAIVLAPFLAKKIGKKHALIWTFSLSLFAGITPISLRLLNVLPPNGSPIVLPLLVVDAFIAVVLVVCGLIIVTSMMADIVEQVQAKTGRRSEGLLFSADTMLKQIVTGVGVMGAGVILQTVGFPEHAVPGQVPPEVLTHLALIYLPLNATTSAIAIALISFYSISRQDHQATLEAIARKRGTPGDRAG